MRQIAISNGFYVFLGVLSGSYQLTVNKTGYLSWTCSEPATIKPDEFVGCNGELMLGVAPRIIGMPFRCLQLTSAPSLVDSSITADVYDPGSGREGRDCRLRERPCMRRAVPIALLAPLSPYATSGVYDVH